MITYSNDWDSTIHQPELELDAVHVWRINLQNASVRAQNLFGLLANDEIERARKFRFRRDHDHFIVVRGVLRMLLGAYIHLPPEQISFQYSAQGRPFIALNQNDVMLDFNVSHSHERALLAFSAGPAVGIDIEYVRLDMDHKQIAERFFSADEIASLQNLPNSLQPIAFFNCWTRKEAFIKATGDGLSRPLDQFSMSLVPDEPAVLFTIQGRPEEVSRWLVQDLKHEPGYAAALAVKNPTSHIHCWEYPLS